MKTKPKLKIRPMQIEPDVAEAAQRFHNAMDSVKDVLVNRELEVSALKLALVARCNLMLEGPPGIAKSMLAEEVFKRITGANTFKLQLMKGTQADQIFGPIFAERYRKDAVWEHNIERMLPTAHLAFLDEVYRASDMLLPAMLGILNERVFHNGPVTVQCPLITAIGTTNFTTMNDELEAFHDRWLMRLQLKPLESSALRLRLLELINTPPQPTKAPPTVSLSDLQVLQRAAKRVTFTQDALDLYDDLLKNVLNRIGKTQKVYVSDRRFVQSLAVIRAAAVLRDPEISEPVGPDDFASLQFTFLRCGVKEHDEAFSQSFEHTLSGYEAYKQEIETVAIFAKGASKFTAQFDPGMSKESARKLLLNVQQVISGAEAIPDERRPKNQRNIDTFEKAIKDMKSLVDDLKTLV